MILEGAIRERDDLRCGCMFLDGRCWDEKPDFSREERVTARREVGELLVCMFNQWTMQTSERAGSMQRIHGLVGLGT